MVSLNQVFAKDVNSSAPYVYRLRWCALAVMAITLLSLMPQLRFWVARGSNWHGAYTILQLDEVLYSAYVSALIEGRPRRNDPVSGRDDHPEAPLPESLFSIQFVPPYAIALPARALGISASTAFIVLMGAAGLLASLSVLWLLISIMGDSKFAAIGMLAVLCFGALAAGQGLVGLLLNLDVRFLGLPFLRGYEPSAPFPLFFVFCALIWQAFTTASRSTASTCALLAGVTFSILIFSYFYLWTAAAAWLVCVACLWFVIRRVDRAMLIRIIIILSLPAIIALGFYSYLLSHVPHTLDKHVLNLTHRPDLLRTPEILGALVLLALIEGVRRKKISLTEPRVIFTASFGFFPFLIFNQQIITGRSIQPYHYQVLISNYVVLLGLVLAVRLLQPAAISRRAALLMASVCLLWGMIEVNLPFQIRYGLDMKNDDMVPVFLSLKERAQHDGTWEGLRSHGKTPALVFSPQYGISTLLPTWAPQGSLLAPGSIAFQGVSEAERKARIYQHLYYCGRNVEYLRELLNDRANDAFLTHFVRSTIFGAERDVPFLTQNFQPIGQGEIEHEVEEYGSFATSFSRDEALQRPLGYAVIPADAQFDFSHIDRWYERDAGEHVGVYTLYHLKLRE
jgi:hypothetical protein